MTQDVTFFSARGHRLAGNLMRPAGPIRAVALFAHCFTCTKQSLAAVRMSEELARLGLATLRFDFTGLGSSEGEFGRAGFGSDVDDLVAAADHLAATVGAPGLLVGHSLGGAAVLAAAARIPSARAVATVGAPADVAHVLGNLKGDLHAIERDGQGEVTIAGRPFPISAAFLASARAARLPDLVAALRVPLLFAHAPLDDVVDVDDARRLFEAAKHPKSFISLDDADHLLTRARDAGYVARLIADWADRYLPEAVEDDGPGEGVVEAVNDGSAFLTTLRAGGHGWVADEPAAVGGEDAGPTPYDLLLGALGACTAMTLRIVARREGIPLDRAAVHLTHERHHRHDGEAGGRLEAIHRQLTITGDLTDAQRERLARVADRCPVHRTLTGTLHIHDGIAGEEAADD